LRGRPSPPGRGTRMLSSSGSSWVLSCRWPAVTSIPSGRPRPSQAKWILVVSPPRYGPMPGPDHHRILGSGRSPFSSAGGVLVGPARWSRPRPPPSRPPRPHRTWSGRARAGVPGPIGLPTTEPLIAGLPGPIAFREVPPGTPVASFHSEASGSRYPHTVDLEAECSGLSIYVVENASSRCQV